jgi:DNA polymerase I
MVKKLFLLDGMALVYRAHFALAGRPVFTSAGVNSSALFGFTQTLLEILARQQPTHLAVAFDTETPTERHREFPQYKAHRDAMPEDISAALPHVRRLIQTMNIPILICEGYEADDIIGTLVRRAERADFDCCMVTPDKDFGQLVTPRVLLYKPGRLADQKEVLGPVEVCRKWGIERPDQVTDILGLWGDASDNIPGVPGIGEKTASRLIAQYGSLERLLENTAELKGRLRQNLEQHRDQALLSKRLATINCAVPLEIDLNTLKLRPPNEPALKQILAEFQFHSIGRRLFGEEYQGGPPPAPSSVLPDAEDSTTGTGEPTEPIHLEPGATEPADAAVVSPAAMKQLGDVVHRYATLENGDREGRRRWLDDLRAAQVVGVAARTCGADARDGRLLGLAFSAEPGVGVYLPLPAESGPALEILEELRPWLEDDRVEKTGLDLKFILSLLHARGLRLCGPLFDVPLAHALIEPDLRHSASYLAETLLHYRPLSDDTTQSQEELDLGGTNSERVADETIERADLALQLRALLEPRLAERGQSRVFHEIEMPLVPVLVEMEHEGIRVEAGVLREFAAQLGREMERLEGEIQRLAGVEFNVNSPKQLGEVLFEHLRLASAPRKTKTGQYATDEADIDRSGWGTCEWCSAYWSIGNAAS